MTLAAALLALSATIWLSGRAGLRTGARLRARALRDVSVPPAPRPKPDTWGEALWTARDLL